jgi:hypothetical protein
MYSIEFKTPIQEGGIIKIPEHYLPQLNGNVKVVIFTEEPTTSPDIIDRLMESPLPMNDAQPLSREEIYESRI